MFNIVIPMAGKGSRFTKVGYDVPKPFVDVLGKPMITKVMENLFHPDARYILIVRQEHLNDHSDLLMGIKKEFNCTIVPINSLTEGAACTVLFARKYIDTADPLIIANSDQIIDVKFSDFINLGLAEKCDGLIMTFVDPLKSTKWSFVKLNKHGYVSEVREKKAISNIATVGIYMFRYGSDFVKATIDMIIHNERVNNEYYVCPVYNYAIKNGNLIKTFEIEYEKMHGLGTPEDLNKYIESKNC